MTIDFCFPGVGHGVKWIVNIGVWEGEDYKRGWHHPCTYLLSQCYSRLQNSRFSSENCFFTGQCAGVESEYHEGKALHAHKCLTPEKEKRLSPVLLSAFSHAPDLWCNCSCVLDYTKISTVLQCTVINSISLQPHTFIMFAPISYYFTQIVHMNKVEACWHIGLFENRIYSVLLPVSVYQFLCCSNSTE